MAKVAASAANAGAEPTRATIAPPITGPASEPSSIAVPFRALPAWSWAAGSSVGMMAAEAGMNRPSPAPTTAAAGPSATSATT